MAFVYYPEITDKDFEAKLMKKLEFFSTYVPPEYQDQSIEDLCRPRDFILQPPQEFMKTYISPSTFYTGILLFYGPGVGKTCTAVSIAERFKEQVIKQGKKIIFTARQKVILDNFRAEIYNINNEKEEGCTGSTYRPPDYLTGKARETWLNQKINKYYQTIGSIKLAKTMVNSDSHEPISDDEMRERFSNTVMIVDEAHELTGDNKTIKDIDDDDAPNTDTREPALFPLLQRVVAVAINFRLILMTATPMRDNAESIIQLINLLRVNDGRPPMLQEKAFTKDNQPNTAYIQDQARGYISHVRGENPITFPSISYDEGNYDLSPPYGPILDSDGTLITDTKLMQQTRFRLIRCPMQDFQFHSYLTMVYGGETESGSMDATGLSQISNIAYRGIYRDYFAYHQDGTSITPTALALRDFSPANLSQCSQKYFQILLNLKHDGTHFVFSQYVSVGVMTLALILEMNGYTQYDMTGVNREVVNWPADYHRPSPMCALCGTNKANHDDTVCKKFIPAKYTIIFGQTATDYTSIQTIFNHSMNRDGSLIKLILGTKATSQGVNFKNVRHVHIADPWHNLTTMYQTISRATRNCSHKSLPPSQRNVNIYLYCSTVPETLYSNDGEAMAVTRYQIFRDLQTVTRNVITPEVLTQPTGYLKLVDPITAVSQLQPINFIHFFTDTNDERLYLRGLRKDQNIKKVERALKEVAVDCGLFHNINYMSKYDTADNTRECDYTTCNFTCKAKLPIPTKITTPNKDTFFLHYSDTEIEKVIIHIRDMVMSHPVLTYEYIRRNIDKIDDQHVLEGIDRMVGRPPIAIPVPIMDKFGRWGYLIQVGKFYIFQPQEYQNHQISLNYRLIPPKVQQTRVNLDDLIARWKEPKINDSEQISNTQQKLVDDYMNWAVTIIQNNLSDIETQTNIGILIDKQKPKEFPAIWEKLWAGKMNNEWSPDQQNAVIITSVYLEHYGVWLPSLKVHMLNYQVDPLTRNTIFYPRSWSSELAEFIQTPQEQIPLIERSYTRIREDLSGAIVSRHATISKQTSSNWFKITNPDIRSRGEGMACNSYNKSNYKKIVALILEHLIPVVGKDQVDEWDSLNTKDSFCDWISKYFHMLELMRTGGFRWLINLEWEPKQYDIISKSMEDIENDQQRTSIRQSEIVHTRKTRRRGISSKK